MRRFGNPDSESVGIRVLRCIFNERRRRQHTCFSENNNDAKILCAVVVGVDGEFQTNLKCVGCT